MLLSVLKPVELSVVGLRARKLMVSRISALLASWPLSGVSKDCASTLEKYGSLSTGNRKRVASIVSPALTLKPLDCTSGDTSAWCGHPDA